MTHSRFAPSNASAWVPCPAASAAAQRYPSPDTDVSREGDAAHFVACCAAAGWLPEAGGRAPNGVTIDHDMLAGAVLYRDAIKEWQDVQPAGWLLGLEQRVHMPMVHSDCYGTADCVVSSPQRLLIADYKYGRLHVDALDNWQLVLYALGALAESPHRTTIAHVDFIIAQPRTHRPVRRWSLTVAELKLYGEGARRAAENADANPHVTIAGKHCIHCSARAHCPAARRYAVGLYTVSMSVGMDELPLEAVAIELQYVERALKALESLASAYSEILEHAINAGQDVPGWRMQRAFGHRKWAAEVEQVRGLGLGFGVDLVEPRPVTPAEAERRGIPKDVVQALTQRPSSLKLSRVTDALLVGVFPDDSTQ